MFSYQKYFINQGLFSRVLDSCLLLVSPIFCRLCNKKIVESYNDGVVCSSCWEEYSLVYNKYKIACLQCGRLDIVSNVNAFQKQCSRCEQVSCSVIRSCGVYKSALKVSLLNLKIHPFLPKRIKELLIKNLKNFSKLYEINSVIPVPLSISREKERGYNQAAIIAKEIGNYLGVGIDLNSLIRAKETSRHRAGLDFIARKQSIKQAFKVLRPRLIAGRSILVVDDVLTSGATIEECSKILINAGAKNVFAFTLAQTVLD